MKCKKDLEKRMYFLVPYNISEIQKGIQCGHAGLDYARKYGNDEDFIDFVDHHKTWIILNGGTTNSERELGTGTLFGTLNQYAEGYGLVYQNPNLFLDKILDRKRYYTEDTGNETEETQFNSRYSRVMADTATLSINLERDMPLLQLIQVGESVNFKPLSLEYVPLSGKYILWSSLS